MPRKLITKTDWLAKRSQGLAKASPYMNKVGWISEQFS